MIALLSALGLSGVGLALIFMPGLRTVVFAVLGKLPWQIWAGVAAVLLLVGGCVWHGRAVESARSAAYAEGKADEKRKWEQAFQTMKLAADTYKQNFEKASADLANERSARYEAESRRIAAGADDLRLRGPGRAAAPRCGSISDSRLSRSTGEPEPGPGGGSDPVPEMPEPEGLAILPWRRLVDLGESHDAWRNEALTWRSWYLGQEELWELRRREFPAPAFGN